MFKEHYKALKNEKLDRRNEKLTFRKIILREFHLILTF